MSFVSNKIAQLDEYRSSDFLNVPDNTVNNFGYPYTMQENIEYNYMKLRDGIYQIDAAGVLGNNRHTEGENSNHGLFFADMTVASMNNLDLTNRYFWPYPDDINDPDVIKSQEGVNYTVFLQKNEDIRSTLEPNKIETYPNRHDPTYLIDLGPMFFKVIHPVNYIRVFQFDLEAFNKRTINGVPYIGNNNDHFYHENRYKGFNLSVKRIGEI